MSKAQFDFFLNIDMKQQVEILRYRYSIAEIVAMPEAVRLCRVKYEIEKGA